MQASQVSLTHEPPPWPFSCLFLLASRWCWYTCCFSYSSYWLLGCAFTERWTEDSKMASEAEGRTRALDLTKLQLWTKDMCILSWEVGKSELSKLFGGSIFLNVSSKSPHRMRHHFYQRNITKVPGCMPWMAMGVVGIITRRLHGCMAPFSYGNPPAKFAREIGTEFIMYVLTSNVPNFMDFVVTAVFQRKNCWNICFGEKRPGRSGTEITRQDTSENQIHLAMQPYWGTPLVLSHITNLNLHKHRNLISGNDRKFLYYKRDFSSVV